MNRSIIFGYLSMFASRGDLIKCVYFCLRVNIYVFNTYSSIPFFILTVILILLIFIRSIYLFFYFFNDFCKFNFCFFFFNGISINYSCTEIFLIIFLSFFIYIFYTMNFVYKKFFHWEE